MISNSPRKTPAIVKEGLYDVGDPLEYAAGRHSDLERSFYPNGIHKMSTGRMHC